jgi:CHASE2 domain-containing sensor protein
LWNSFGCFDYYMTQTRNAEYLAQFTPEQRAYFDNFPMLAEVTWALGVWGALAGSILLLMRSRHAVTAFAISLAGLAGSSIWQFLLADAPMPGMSNAMYAVNAVIWLGCILFLYYAMRQKKAGVLR